VDERRKIQHELAFESEERGEAPKAPEEGIESTAAGLGTESQANTDKLIEEVCEKENVKEALRRVKANAGAAGVDGMSVKELPEYLLSPHFSYRGALSRASTFRGIHLSLHSC
jgi:RNA-directed DNA polymerase